jgi:hypothetical protein
MLEGGYPECQVSLRGTGSGLTPLAGVAARRQWLVSLHYTVCMVRSSLRNLLHFPEHFLDALDTLTQIG